MTALYDKYLNKDHLLSIANKYNRNPTILEKYVMNFKIHYMMGKKFDNMITRGGMAIQFYQNDGISRLSDDIDIIVDTTIDATEQIMSEFIESSNYIITPYIPKPGNRSPAPILTYHVKYPSVLEKKDEFIKIDFLCDSHMPTQFTKIYDTSPINYFKLLHPVTVLDKGALVADKLSSLAMNTIGYGAKPSPIYDVYDMPHQDKMPKQIYDTSSILKHPDSMILKQALDTFKSMTRQKCRYYSTNKTITIMDVSKDICESLYRLIDLKSKYQLTKNANNTFNVFRNSYLGKDDYTLDIFSLDLLLLLIFTCRLYLYITDKLSLKELLDTYLLDVQRFYSYSNMERSQRIEENNQLFEEFSSIEYDILKKIKGLENNKKFLIMRVLSLHDLL
ncbi:MAG: hypothetical protein K8823_1005 [Cenarchaeum symbiont of Oopsacas minuta]|nr:hypothetical protein [Cenarchaeum symbiont of Oopsacas minuta]